jgi:hypothetical protein
VASSPIFTVEPFKNYCAVSTGTAIVSIGISLVAMSVIVLALGASGAGGFAVSGHPLHAAVEDGAVMLYLTELVSVSFFHRTAGMRFAAVPGLALVAAVIVLSVMVTVRVVGGSVRRRMLVAMLVPVPYALLSGLGARYLHLRFTGPGIGRDTVMLPATGEAFLFPLAWGLLFAPLGGLLGAFGKRWRREVLRLLAAWAIPVRSSLRALGIGVALTSAVVVIGGAPCCRARAARRV